MGKGEHQAFRELFAAYSPGIYNFALKLTKSEHLAEEVLQETFLRLWINREKIAGYEHPPGWLFLVASNLCITHLRKKSKEIKQKKEIANESPSAEEVLLKQLENKELTNVIESAINELPSKRRHIFRMNRQEGKTQQQIADELNISINTVKDHLLKATQFLRQRLEQHSGTSISVVVLVHFL